MQRGRWDVSAYLFSDVSLESTAIQPEFEANALNLVKISSSQLEFLKFSAEGKP